MEQRIHDGVAAQLAAKGLTPTNATPDAFVATHGVTQDHGAVTKGCEALAGSIADRRRLVARFLQQV